MRLGDVDERERRPLANLLVEGGDVAGPATEGRSGVAAEDEDERPSVEERTERDGSSLRCVEKLERRHTVSDPESVRPSVPEQRGEDGFAQLVVLDALDVRAILIVDEGIRREVGAAAHAPIVEIG
jgi:hypothetical protein